MIAILVVSAILGALAILVVSAIWPALRDPDFVSFADALAKGPEATTTDTQR